VGGANAWNDPAKGKELGLAMYQQGADIIFQIAAGSGLGVFQAAQEMENMPSESTLIRPPSSRTPIPNRQKSS